MDIKFNGLAKLEAQLKANTPEMKKAVMKIVEKNSQAMARKTKMNMAKAYTGHYEWKKGKGKVFVRPSGYLEGTIDYRLSNAGFTGKVAAYGADVDYFKYLEYGTRFMSPRPTVRPAFLAQSAIFTADLKKVFK